MTKKQKEKRKKIFMYALILLLAIAGVYYWRKADIMDVIEWNKTFPDGDYTKGGYWTDVLLEKRAPNTIDVENNYGNLRAALPSWKAYKRKNFLI